jgi:hypothetical protein
MTLAVARPWMAPVTVSRAQFLKVCGLAFLGAGADIGVLHGLPGEAPTASAMPGRVRMQDATAQLFREHLNTEFRVQSADGISAGLVLAELSERDITKNVEQFSLIFHAPAGAALPGGTHTLQHSALGAFDLFMVPVGPGVRRTVYQACFSRHLSARDSGSQPGRLGARSSWRT